MIAVFVYVSIGFLSSPLLDESSYHLQMARSTVPSLMVVVIVVYGAREAVMARSPSILTMWDLLWVSWRNATHQ